MDTKQILLGAVLLGAAYYFLVYNKTEPIPSPTPEPTTSPSPTPNPLAPDAWYRFMNNVKDSSGHGYNGSPDGVPIYKDLTVGNSRAIQLDGENDYFKVNTNKIGNGNYLTVAFYINIPNQVSGQYKYAKDIVRSNCPGGGNWGVTTAEDFNTSGRLMVQSGWVFGANKMWIQPSMTIPKGAWTHVAVVYDRPNEIIYVYHNKNLIGRYEGTRGTKTYSTGFAVGKDCAGFLKGMIADLRIWNRALTSSEISKLS